MNTKMHLDRDIAILNAGQAVVDNDIDAMIAWENGELDDEETVSLFQRLIDSGLAWKLQGAYGRMAARMIECGVCQLKSARLL
jgi:hypothetical protein